ncbi:MAG: crotonase/enoyl-CoA hydratase family protein [Acidimicrobiia bacterium]|nr:crotonase/enoyl-CoA hydratase family protein [Acidimicrobiia bacterium]
MAAITTRTVGPVLVVTINRPDVRNAVDGPTAAILYETFVDFDRDDDLSVAVLTGADGTFCSGADLGGIIDGRANPVTDEPPDQIVGTPGPMGPTRLTLTKPSIAAVEGHAVAGGLELAVWCDLRVAATDAVFGVYCRRWGVPLVDGGTIRLPRLIGHSNAMDLILTGRGVRGDEAKQMGLVNRLVEPGRAVTAAIELATEIAAFPQLCTRNDRTSAIQQWGDDLGTALAREVSLGRSTLESGEALDGARRFASGEGRHGSFRGD